MKIGKTFTWEMGHRLPYHSGGCKNLHGHSYTLRVDVEGEPDKDGMIVDFDEISHAVRPLLAELDHAFLCQDSDHHVKDFLMTHEMKIKLVPFPSTVENITQMIANHVQDTLFERPSVSAITLHVKETTSSFAELRLERSTS